MRPQCLPLLLAALAVAPAVGWRAVPRMQAAPVKVKDTVNKLKESLQAGLKAQCSRMHVQLPKASLGIEGDEKGAPVDARKPDREAARAILEMFQVLADTSCCVFNSEVDAAAARSAWEIGNVGGLRIGAVVGLDAVAGSRAARRKAKASKSKMSKKDKKRGALKSLAFLQEDDAASADPMDNIPAGTEVLLVVAPTTATLEKVREMDEKFGLGTVIIVLNPQLDANREKAGAAVEFVESKFETAFYLDEAGDNLLYREWGKDFQLWSAEGLMGQQTLVHAQSDRFYPSEVPAMEEAGTLKPQKKGEKGLFGGLFG